LLLTLPERKRTPARKYRAGAPDCAAAPLGAALIQDLSALGAVGLARAVVQTLAWPWAAMLELVVRSQFPFWSRRTVRASPI
jgi:hypothetical protein